LLAMDSNENASTRNERVIVSDHREQARSYNCYQIRKAACQ